MAHGLGTPLDLHDMLPDAGRQAMIDRSIGLDEDGDLKG